MQTKIDIPQNAFKIYIEIYIHMYIICIYVLFGALSTYSYFQVYTYKHLQMYVYTIVHTSIYHVQNVHNTYDVYVLNKRSIL